MTTESHSTKMVFLSSTARDLVEFRKAAYEVIESLEDYHCIRMEDFTASATTPEAYIKQRVQECHLFVGIVGLCYGSRSPGSPKSYSEIEYEAAQEVQIPCLMFLCPEDFPVPAKILHDDGGWDEQQEFRRKVSRDRVRSTFTTPPQLAAQIASAIRNWERNQLVSSRSQRNTQPLYQEVDCVILCGGYAKRLWPLTIDISKVLLPVGGRPALAHTLDFIRRSRLIRRIIVSTNQKFGSQLNSFCDTYRSSGLEIPLEVVVEPSRENKEKLGPVGALNYILTRSNPHDLLVIGGDNLFGFELERFLEFAETTQCSSNALYEFESKDDLGEYGTVHVGTDNMFLEFLEKQSTSSYRNVSTACYYLRAPDVQAISRYLVNGGDPDSLGNFLHWLVMQGSPLAGFVFSSFWFDIGTREKLLTANWHYLEGTEQRQIDRNMISNNVHFDPSAEIKDSQLGPNVHVGPNVKIISSEIRNSIIMEKASIVDSLVVDSIVGPESIVEGSMLETVCGPHSLYSARIRHSQ